MGLQRTFKCTICNYCAIVAGGRTRGFENITDTFVCNDCKTLVDIVVENVDAEMIVEWLQEIQQIAIQCPKCLRTNVEKWNLKTQACPKCNGLMKLDMDGVSIVWD